MSSSTNIEDKAYETLFEEGDFPEPVFGPRFTDADSVDSFIGPKGRFCSQIPGFIPRDGQITLSRKVQEAFAEGEFLIAEAGTGTGKTYAYLLPALLSSKTTVISTGSKALQDQLINKDLPKMCDLLHLPHAFFALKGFSNYLCRARFDEFRRNYEKGTGLGLDAIDGSKKTASYNEEVDRLQRYVIEQDTLAQQDSIHCKFAEVNALFSRDIVSKVCCDRHTCRGKRCRYHDQCFAILARQRAVKSKVVVINHALFFADLQIEDNFNPQCPCILLPKYQLVIFDEAHEIPDEGRNHLSREVSSVDIKKLGEDIETVIKQESLQITSEFTKGYQQLKEASEHLYDYLLEKGKISHRNFLYYRFDDFNENRIDTTYKHTKVNQEFRNVMADLWLGVKALYNFVDEYKEYCEEAFSSMHQDLREMLQNIEELMHIDSQANQTHGVSVGSVVVSKKGYSLKITPLEIGSFFGNFLSKCEENHVGVLATSATISVAGEFSKFRRDIGAYSNNILELSVPSSFDYGNNAALLVSEHFPEPNTAGREETIVSMLEDIIRHNRGGIFILTTSILAINAFEVSLRQHFQNEREILSQNGSMSNTNLLKRFREQGNAILIGTSSFWAGVDVQGSALSLVIIDKLPFQSPSDPVFKARCSYYDQGKDNHPRSFVDISVPEAVIDLRQGAGRLIRHEKDTGAMVICDPRILKKGYGNLFMKSLPPVTICKNLAQLQAFLSGLNQRNAVLEANTPKDSIQR